MIRKLLALAFIILAGNAFLGYAVYQSNQRLHDSERSVHHTEEVISLSGNILSLAIDIETASRGFVIANDSSFLDPLFAARKSVFFYIDQLRQLTRDNVVQVRRVDSLDFYMLERLNFSVQQAELRSKSGLSAAINFTSNKEGKRMTDHLRQITYTIQQAEARLLKDRKQMNEQSVAVFNRFSMAMFVLVMTFTVLLFFVTANILRQNRENEARSTALIVANSELAIQSELKEKRARELIVANEELAFQNREKEKRAAELQVANRELMYQNDLKETRAGELVIANKELAFQNEEKRRRAAELIVANQELAFQSELKERRAAELIVANEELAFQNSEKEKRAAELLVANSELMYQNGLKEERAGELIVANKELAFQNEEKRMRAAELLIANQELAFQNEEKEKRASELTLVNKELEAFSYVSSHDLQEPLRKIRTFAMRILDTEQSTLSLKGKDYFGRMQKAASRMQQLIDDLLAFSHLNIGERKYEFTDLNRIVEEVCADLKENIDQSHAIVQSEELCGVDIIPFQFRQLMHNLISNALKFSRPSHPPRIVISSQIKKGNELGNEDLSGETTYCHITVSDNGIGFDEQYKGRIFEVFQRLHRKEDFEGTGIGLAIVKKVVDNHNGLISVASEIGVGTTFDIYIPIQVHPVLETTYDATADRSAFQTGSDRNST